MTSWNFENFHKKPWGQLIITETTFLRFLNQHGVTESLQGQRGLGDALGEEFLCTECLCNELLLRTGKPRVLSSHEQPQLTLKTEFILPMSLSGMWLPEEFGAHVQDLLAVAALHSSERSVINQRF